MSTAELRKRSPTQASAKREGTDVSDDSNDLGMKATLGLQGGISYIIGVMIGSGIFVSPAGVLEGAGSVGLSLCIWVIGGFLSLFGALAYAELGTMIPQSGGEYAYLLEAMHPVFPFLFAWASATILKPSTVAIIALTCAEYILVPLFNDGCGSPPSVETKLLAITVILVLAAVNCMSVDAANSVQIFFTGAKLLALAIIILGGMVKLGQGYTEYLENGFENTNSNIGEIAIAFYSSMWAYDGWNNLNLVTEELKNPSRNLPLAIVIGIPLVTVLYVLTNISYFTVLSPEDMLSSPAVAVTWAERVIPNVAWLIPIFVAMSTFGAANGSLFSTSRLLYVAGREGHMVKSLSMVHVIRRTPVTSIIFTVVLGSIMVIPSNIGSLINFFSFAAWMFYALVFGCHIYLRFRRPNYERPFKCPMILSAIAIVIAVFIVLTPLIYAPEIEFLYAFLFIVGGVVFYFPFVHFAKEMPGMKQFNTGLQLFLQVAPPPKEELDDFIKTVTETSVNVKDQTAPDEDPENKLTGEETKRLQTATSTQKNQIEPIDDQTTKV